MFCKQQSYIKAKTKESNFFKIYFSAVILCLVSSRCSKYVSVADVFAANSRNPKPLQQYNSPLILDVASDLRFTSRTYISSEHRLYTKHVSALLSPTTLNENATSNSKHLPPPTCLCAFACQALMCFY